MSVIFNDQNLGDLFVCGSPEVQWINAKPDTLTIPGRDGLAFRDITLGALLIKFQVAAHGNSEQHREAFSYLAQILDVDEPKKLYLPNMQGRYYLAVPTDVQEITPGIDGATSTVAFIALDPAAYGETLTETLPSGGSVSLEIEGTYPTSIHVQGEVVPDVATGRYGIRHVQTGNWLHVKTTGENIPIHWVMTDGDTWGDVKANTWGDIQDSTWRDATHATIVADSACEIELDTGTREVRINDAWTVPTLDSNWIILSPGPQTITNDLGDGDVEITWTERWL